MKNITFFTVHQAPHNTYIFKSIEKKCHLEIFYLQEKLKDYGWKSADFFYPGKIDTNLITYIKSAFKSDLVIINGWNNYRYIVLILLLLITNHKFAFQFDFNITSLKRFRIIKKTLLKKIPFLLITGVYGERFLKKYLRTQNIFDFPYGIEMVNIEKVNMINKEREMAIDKGDQIRVFISNRFIERKGYHLVHSLIRYLKQQNNLYNFQFTIAGNGPLLEKFRNSISLIDHDIVFLGWIDYTKYRENILSCDIYLHCSEFEPYGIPPVDALVCKKEIVVTSKIYSKFDLLDLGGYVHEFNYKKEIELFRIFNKFTTNRQDIYKSNKLIKLDSNSKYLFCSRHTKALNEMLKD